MMSFLLVSWADPYTLLTQRSLTQILYYNWEIEAILVANFFFISTVEPTTGSNMLEKVLNQYRQ